MNKAIYTAIFGDYEDLKEPAIVTQGWDYICFTDMPLQSKVWKVINIEKILENRRMARYVKINPHIYLPQYEFTMWIDASFQINVNIDLIWKYFTAPFTAPSHPIRKCVYQEVRSCIANKRGEPDLVAIQGAVYKQLGVPNFNGIITSGLLMRDNSIECINLCIEWWKEVEQHSTRDQIAFAKASIGHKFSTFNWDYSQSKELKYIKHYHERH